MDTKKFEKKSKFDPNRLMYIDDECALVYLREVKVGKQWMREICDRIEFTPETADIIIEADEWMHREDLDKRYAEENLDYGFLNQSVRQAGDGYGEEGDNFDGTPLENIEDPDSDVFNQLFGEEEPENPLSAKVREAVDSCSEKQQDIFYMHFGMGVQMEEMRAAEELATGKPVKQQSVFDRKKKLIQNVAKKLGAEPPRRIKK